MNMYDLRDKYGILSIDVDNRYTPAYSSMDFNYRPSHMKIESTVTVKISDTNLKKMLESVDKFEEMNKQYYADMYVRDSNPTVQKAYEKYQMFLEIARSETKNDRIN
jgi:NAD kinase